MYKQITYICILKIFLIFIFFYFFLFFFNFFVLTRVGHKHPQPPPPFEQWVLYPLNLLLTFIYIGIFLWGFSFNSLFIMAVEFLNQRSIEEFKSSNNISKLFIHKSVRKQLDENGNSILVPQRYENGTCKYFACDAAGKIFVAVSKAVCADLDKTGTFAPNRSVVVSDVTDCESGNSVTSLIYTGTEAVSVL